MPVKPKDRPSKQKTSSDARVVIVSGAGTGLGRAYALDLAARGMRVVVNNRRREIDAAGQSSAQRVVDEIHARGGDAIADESDVSDLGSGAAMVQRALSTWGRLDAVVANAGVDQHQAFHKISVDGIRSIVEVNFFGSLYLVHAAYPHMRANKHGRIVVSTSSAGLHGLHGLTAYAASKAALIGLMRSVAAEGSAYNVLCNAIAPYAATRMTAAHGDAAFTARMSPERVAPLVAVLVNEHCRVSGEVIVTGGGAFRRAAAVESIEMHSCESTQEQLQARLLQPFAPARASTFPDALIAFGDYQKNLKRMRHANN